MLVWPMSSPKITRMLGLSAACTAFIPIATPAARVIVVIHLLLSFIWPVLRLTLLALATTTCTRDTVYPLVPVRLRCFIYWLSILSKG
ncbi:hypothetical protein D3C72_2148800 [compost metagenome]